MSFIEVPGPHYIKRTLVFVNSNDSDPVRSSSNYDFTFNLVEEIQEVFSIELVNYTVPRVATPTLLGKVDQYSTFKTGLVVLVPQNSNMIYDLLVQNETRSDQLLVTGNLDPGIFLLGGQVPWGGLPLDYVTFFIALFFDLAARYALAASSSPVFGGGNYDLVVSPDQNFQLQFGLINNVAIPTTYGFVTALFASGPNKDNQMSIPLGFQPFQDQTSNTATAFNLLQPPYMVNLYQFTYVDVFLAQAAENIPWARMYTVNELNNFSASSTVPRRSRMLKTPVRNLKFLDFSIRVQGGRVLTELSNTGFDMTVEVLSIAQIPKVPEWVLQRLTL